MTTQAILETLSRALPGQAGGIDAADAGDGMPTIIVPRELLVRVSTVLRDDPALRFALLADLFSVDYYPREPRFEVVYLLGSLGTSGFGDTAKRLRMKVRVPNANPTLPSVSDVWAAANWAEREAFDFYGLQFEGHPNLARLLMPDDWEGFPMRKDYPVQIKEPVKTYEPLQLSEEEFVANVQAARGSARED